MGHGKQLAQHLCIMLLTYLVAQRKSDIELQIALVSGEA